jgi:hypothetical protein
MPCKQHHARDLTPEAMVGRAVQLWLGVGATDFIWPYNGVYIYALLSLWNGILGAPSNLRLCPTSMCLH